jgi:hypothetical protein
MTVIPQLDDVGVYDSIHVDDLWCLDKLILSKKLGYTCGPAGIAPLTPGYYVVRPIMNLKMMGVGATIQYLKSDSIPDGYFWCEQFKGRHLSFDYHWGKQSLAVEGFRTDPDRLDRFSRWTRVADKFLLPKTLQTVADKYPWFNIEVIGTCVIEVHFRYNDDFANHDADIIIPVWRDEFYSSPAGDRLGFMLQSIKKETDTVLDTK